MKELEKLIVELPLIEINPFVRRASQHVVEGGLNTGVRINPHYQLHYICKGAGSFTINGVMYRAKRGGLYFWGPGVKHIITSDQDNPMLVIGVQFDLTQNFRRLNYPCIPLNEDTFSLEAINEMVTLTDCPPIPPFIPLHELQKAELYLEQLVNFFVNKAPYYKEATSTLLKAVIIMAIQNEGYHLLTKDAKKSQVFEVANYMRENYRAKLTNIQLAKLFSYHPHYLNQLVQNYTGHSIQQYLIQLRMNEAIDLLQHSNKTIGEIAEWVGGYDIHYFSRLFRKKVGLSPSEFR